MRIGNWRHKRDGMARSDETSTPNVESKVRLSVFSARKGIESFFWPQGTTVKLLSEKTVIIQIDGAAGNQIFV